MYATMEAVDQLMDSLESDLDRAEGVGGDG